ncbi:MAG TPA: aldehyde ferredoxin oxidoreductase family protein [bacterium]|nr:aldehyde ferredoxin oxidoreductase family protein [bacterium]
MASKYSGYMGSILDIDLSDETVMEYHVSDSDRRKYLGGKSLASKILYDELTPGIDPLSEENILVFMTGPLTGSGAPCTSRFDVSTKNVLTGGIASSNCGGTFGINLKKAGYDGAIIRGKANKPTLITIDEENVEFIDATDLWGKDTEETQEVLKKKYSKRHGMMVIGPAGENLVKYACIISAERAAGRCGVGAVMGSKNLKAIIATGKKKVPVHDKDGFKEAIKSWIKLLKEHPATGGSLPQYGTAGLVNIANATGTLPTHNFTYGHYENAEKISGEELADKHLVSNFGCVSCPIRCGRLVRLGDKHVKGPEYETLGMLGPNIENDNLQKIIDWNYQMDLLGMDTISAASSIAFAMELNEKGLWKTELEFGKIDNIDRIIDDIAFRRGIGDDLANGVKSLSEKYGGAEFAMHSKGMEFSAYEPRRAVGHGLGYATSNRGGCHINGGYLVYFEALGPVLMDPLTERAKPEFCVFQQNMMDAVSAAGNCIFTTYALIPKFASDLVPPASPRAKIASDVLLASGSMLHAQGLLLRDWMLPFHVPLIPHTDVISKLTGMNMDLGHFASAGERCFTLERLFNLREGIDASSDSLPSRLTDVPQLKDKKETKVPLNNMLKNYYKVRDWDRNGIPRKRLLSKLELDFADKDINKARKCR